MKKECHLLKFKTNDERFQEDRAIKKQCMKNQRKRDKKKKKENQACKTCLRPFENDSDSFRTDQESFVSENMEEYSKFDKNQIPVELEPKTFFQVGEEEKMEEDLQETFLTAREHVTEFEVKEGLEPHLAKNFK